MKKLIARANKRISIGWAAALLASSYFVSMFLGLLRDRLLNANFGVESLELAAYRAAFKVPDFMFIVLVSGALSVTFIPVLKDRLDNYNKKSAWELSSSLLNFLALSTAVASVILVIFADPIIRYLVAPGLDEHATYLAISMMRIIAINPLLFAISSVFTSIQQAVGRFFFFALAPSVYSLGIIFGILVLAPRVGIFGVALGVVLGSIIQLLISMVGLIGLGFSYTMKINWRHHGFRRVLSLLPSRSLDQGMDYFLSLVEINLASRISLAAINQWETAFMLHFVPISLIGIAISTAAFPQMSERIAQGRPDLFKKEFIGVIRVIIWLALPTAVVAFFGRGYLVRLLVAEGNSTISALLGLLVVSIFFRAMFHIISRSFYAQQDTKTPLYASIVTIFLNIVLAIVLVELGYGVRGLAVAQSIAATIEVFVLMAILMHRFKGLLNRHFVRGVVGMVIATSMMAPVMYGLVKLFPLRATDVGFFSLVPKFGLIVVAGLLSYLCFSYVIGIREARPIVQKAGKLIFKPIKIN